MIKKLIYLTCLGLGLLSLGSCDDKVAKGDTYLDLLDDQGHRASTVEFARGEGERTLDMTSNTDWTITVPYEAQSWLDVTPTASSNDQKVTITVSANDGYERSAVLKLKVSGKAGALMVTVKQDGDMLPAEPLPDNLKDDCILDVQFNQDGTAVDVSGKGVDVKTVPGAGLVTYESRATRSYVAHFNHVPGSGFSSGYYRVDYTEDSDLWKKLADGHSLEILVRYDADYESWGGEIKPFSAMEAGGTGFLISKKEKGQELTFLPNVSENGKSTWRWATSQTKPAFGRYYHLVGVWNKEEKKAYVYLDGVLKNTVDAPGNLNIPGNAKARWICIGGDAGPNGAQAAWKGDIAIARIFDSPLTQAKVTALYDRVKGYSLPVSTINVDNVVLPSGIEVKAGAKYPILGTGFSSGDVISFQSVTGKYVQTAPCEVSADKAVVTLPSDIVTGSYKVVLKRGGAFYPLGVADLTVTDNPAALKVPDVVAHRGFHKSAPENSIAAVKAAKDLGVFGAEIDVWRTTDGRLVVNHDAKINNIVIQNSAYDKLKDVKLSNGESLPTLEAMLDCIGKDSKTKLIIEIKTHNSQEKQQAAATDVVSLVKSKGMDKVVEYIAFDYETCKVLAAADKSATVGYLNGDKSPAEVAADGIKCVDYQLKVFNSNPTWIKEAQDKSVIVNVWTVNSDSDIISAVAKGVDRITTDNPDRIAELAGLLLN